MLSDKDYEGFHQLVYSSNCSSDQFEITTIDYVDRLERLYPEFSRVSILHKPTNIATRYVAGCNDYWLRMLEADLKGGAFTVI